MAEFFEDCTALLSSPKSLCNWITNDVLRELKERKTGIKDFDVRPEGLVSLVKMAEDGVISLPVAREVFVHMVDTGRDAAELVKEKGLLQISDKGELEQLVLKVLDENPAAVSDYHKGKKASLGFLVGQIMRQSKGKANPKVVNKLLAEKLKAG